MRFQDNTGALVFYDRPDTEGPKISNYEIVTLDSNNCQKMKNVLTQTNGILGSVKKIRHLYMVGETRIHIDKVENLGNFMELEVMNES